jgi:hypothetical protein
MNYNILLCVIVKMSEINTAEFGELPNVPSLDLKITFLYKSFQLNYQVLKNMCEMSTLTGKQTIRFNDKNLLEQDLKIANKYFTIDDYKRIINPMKKEIKKYGYNTQCFDPNKRVILHNVKKINRDKRGTTYLDIISTKLNKNKLRLNFHKEWELEDNTLLSFLEGLYQIKSHKFDNWYELFSGVSSYLEEKFYGKNILHIFIDFDHGS